MFKSLSTNWRLGITSLFIAELEALGQSSLGSFLGIFAHYYTIHIYKQLK